MIAKLPSLLLTQIKRWHKEPLIPGALLLLAAGSLAFIDLAESVWEEEQHSYDQKILLAMREPGDPADPIGPKWLEEMGRDVTALGGFALLTGLTVASVGLMLLLGRARLALLTAVAITSGMMLSSGLKNLFDRPRPDLVPHGVWVSSASFPSGHAMMSALVYLTLGVLLARTQSSVRVRLYIITLSVVITLGVGISRVYLGVHWPTDVLAGWIVGGLWALTFGLLALLLKPKSKESENLE